MKLLATPPALLLLAALACPLSAQKVGQPDGPPDDPGRPGGYNGPGDTVDPSTGGTGGTGGDPGPVTGTDPSTPIPGSTTPASPYAEGANPFARPNIPGLGATDAEPPPITPASRPRVESPNSWKLWWHYNRWDHLAAVPTLSESGAGGFYMGRGETAEVSPLLRASQAQIRDVVQPALIRAIRRGGRPELQIYAIQALAKLRDVMPDPKLGGFADVVRIPLSSGNQEVAEKAVLALGIRGEDRYASWLTAILKDEPLGRDLVGRQRIGVRLRAFAAYGLGLLGERTHSPEVRALIYDSLKTALWVDRVEVQSAALTALGMTPMPLDNEFVGESELFTGRTRVDQILEMLSFFGDADQSYVARSQAPTAIARLLQGAPESLRARAGYTFLASVGRSSKELREVQNACVIALGNIGRSGGDPLDEQILKHLSEVAYRSSAHRSTRFLSMVSVAEAAARRGTGDEPYPSLQRIRKLLLTNLSRSRGETQAWTALGLGVLEETAPQRGEVAAPASGRMLRQLFTRTRSGEVAGAIAIALGMMRDQESQELLRTRMRETGEEFVRGYTALALGMIGNPAAIEDLSQVLTESTQKPFVVENVAIALALLGDQGIGQRLFEILEDSSRPTIQASVASAMGWIKDPRPLTELCKRLLDPRKGEMGRAWTAVAIGRICDQDRWPWLARMSTDAQYDVWLPTLIEPQLQNGLLDLP
ncbi:MAG TPA: HEAT repeat domain-containing protein [Planctomycetes bacterium]|nr:HEAT repeat domain-containing protein [Planctomycetota bacterium]